MAHAPVTREDVRRRVDAAKGFVKKYHHWIGEDNMKLIEALWKLVTEEDDVADQLALILEQEK